MSEHTLCNYCSLQVIQNNARLAGLRVTLLPGELEHAIGGVIGVDVLVHPRGLRRNQARIDRRKYFKAWFWELTDHCVC